MCVCVEGGLLGQGEDVSEEDAAGGVRVHLRGEEDQQQLHTLHVDVIRERSASDRCV